MFKSIEIYKKLNINIYVLSISQLINRLGTFVMPFLALYLSQKKQLSSDKIGTFMSLTLFFSFTGSFIGGKLLDKYNGKYIYVTFQLLAGILFIICPYVSNLYLFLFLIALSNLCYSAVVPTIRYLLAINVEEDKMQEAYSLLNIGNNIGLALGPLVGAFLFTKHSKLLFIGDGITCGIAVILVLIFSSNLSGGSNSEIENNSILRYLFKKNKKLILFYFAFALIVVVYSQSTFGLPLTLAKIYLEKGNKMYGQLLSFSSLISIFFTAKVTFHTKNRSALSNILIGIFLITFGYGLLGIIKIHWLYFFSTIFFTIGQILILTNISVYIAENTTKQFLGRLNGFISIFWSLGSMFGTFVVGKLFYNFNLKVVWGVVACIGMISSAMIIYLLIQERKYYFNKFI